MAQDSRSARLVLLGALADPQDLTVTLGIDRTGHPQGYIAHVARPGPYHNDAVQIQIGVIAYNVINYLSGKAY